MQAPTSDNRQRRKRITILTSIAVGILALGLVIVPDFLFILSPHYHGTVVWDRPQVKDFSLPRADGGTFQMSHYKGQILVLYFGYTSCPDVCPATLYNLARMMKNLADRSQGVSVVFITVDPQTDTPQRMVAYLAAFNPTVIGLVGSAQQLQPIYDQFGVTLLRADQGQSVHSTGIGHTTSLFVIDRQGRMRVQLHEGDTAQGITSDIQNLLNEPS